MAFHFQHLEARVREFMASEVATDVAASIHYKSERLTDEGRSEWPRLLDEAVRLHDEVWLASQLRQRQLLVEREGRKGRIVSVPWTAADTLAEGEFNRYYVRGVCLRAMADGIEAVEVCRGKEVENPRATSEALIGHKIPAGRLLADLRVSRGVETALGIPAGPNSGLTVRLPAADSATAIG